MTSVTHVLSQQHAVFNLFSQTLRFNNEPQRQLPMVMIEPISIYSMMKRNKKTKDRNSSFIVLIFNNQLEIFVGK